MSDSSGPRTLGSAIHFLSGFAFSSAGFDSINGLPLIRIRDLGGVTTAVRFNGAFDQNFLIRDGDILIGMDGDFEVHQWLGGEALLNQRVCKVEPISDEIDRRFLFWYLKPNVAGIHRKAPQTTVRHLSAKELAAIELPSIDSDCQRVVGRILDTLDTAIHQTEALIAKLKVVKQGLLHDLLTRGIDANGELRPPQSEAPCLYKPSTLGWIPKEWQDSLAEAEFHIDAGITLGSHRVPRRRPTKYLRVANVYRNRLAIEDVASLEASESEARLKALEVGDLLMVEGHASTSEIGRCAIADERVRGMVFQNHLFRLRCMRLLPDFGLLWLNSDYSQSYWRREAATSSGLNTINRTKLRCLGVALPPSAEQALIASRARAIATRIHCEARILGKLKTERSGLMNDLLTGRVRVTPLLDAATA